MEFSQEFRAIIFIRGKGKSCACINHMLVKIAARKKGTDLIYWFKFNRLRTSFIPIFLFIIDLIRSINFQMIITLLIKTRINCKCEIFTHQLIRNFLLTRDVIAKTSINATNIQFLPHSSIKYDF